MYGLYASINNTFSYTTHTFMCNVPEHQTAPALLQGEEGGKKLISLLDLDKKPKIMQKYKGILTLVCLSNIMISTC